MRKYKHVFFDLDRTLWDFDQNTTITLYELIKYFKLDNIVPDPQKFTVQYHKYNEEIWDLYRKKQIRKNDLRIERFRRLLHEYEIYDESIIQNISSYYIEHSPRKPKLLEGAKEILEYLAPNYSLYIVSNGFYEAQQQKLISSGIAGYFKKVFTSERIGDSKPSRYFFECAIKACNAKKTESIIIGDDLENDIRGAMKFGIDQIWLTSERGNYEYEPTYKIKELKELRGIL